MNLPSDLKYHPEHMWAHVEGDMATLGITHFAQDQLGKLVYIDLPEVGGRITANSEMGAVESAKSVSDLVAPVNGQVLMVNGEVVDEPSLVNEDPYGRGWMVKVRLAEGWDGGGLLDAQAYAALLNG